MGLFRRISDGLNEEFVIGAANVRRYEADPDSLDDILAAQRACGIGSARGLREFARQRAAEELAAREHIAPRRARTRGRGGLLRGIGRFVVGVGLALLVVQLWSRRRCD